LLSRAVLLGLAALVLLGGLSPDGGLLHLFGWALLVDLLLLLGESVWARDPTEAGRRAHAILTEGEAAEGYWFGGMVLGHAVPMALLLLGERVSAIAAICCIGGIYLYERAFVRAPQLVPNS
jgi:hypothetical protein